MNNRPTKQPHPGVSLLRQILNLQPKQINYDEYIKSPQWKRKAIEAKKRAGYRCQVCNSPDNLNAHHRTYERLGSEQPGDITVLCRECHKLFHGK